MSLNRPGEYAVELLPDDEPKDYTAEVISSGGPVAALTGSWPQGNKFFSVKVDGFNGDRAKLYDTLVDAKQVANPLTSIEPLQNVTVSFATFGIEDVPPPPSFDEKGRYLPRVATLPKRNPARVWMLFPLTKAEADKAVAEYSTADDTSLKLPAHIRDVGTNAANAEPQPLNEKSKPLWYELPGLFGPDGRTTVAFGRAIPVADYGVLRDKYKDGGVWRLVVWEFGPPNAPAAIETRRKGAPQGSYVVAEEVKELYPEIAGRAARDTPPKKE